MICERECGRREPLVRHFEVRPALLGAAAVAACLWMAGAAEAQGIVAANSTQEAATIDAASADAATGANAGAAADDDQAAATGGGLGEVEVTATRVERSGYTAPSQTTVVSTQTLQTEGVTNIAQALDQMPEFKADTGPTTNGIRDITPGANYADLYGLGALRTLVLVDGQRYVPEVATDLDSYQVDLNQIPSIMIERTDVVTGGASAQWGSDAIGGVVNIILKKDFTGLQTEASGGASVYGDNQNYHLATLAGSNLGEKGHIEAALEYDDNNGVESALTRPWGREAAAEIPAPANKTGLLDIISNDVQYSTQTPGGIITSGPLMGTAFGPGGVPYQFPYGSDYSTSNMIGGGNGDVCNEGGCGPENANNSAWVEPPTERFDFFSRGDYDFTDAVQGFATYSYSQTWAGGSSLPARDTSDSISINNPFLPPSIVTAMQADGLTTIPLGRVDYDIGNVTSDIHNYTSRLTAGLQGTVFGNWKWNIGTELGSNFYVQHVIGNRIHPNYNNALDAITDPATGAIICAANYPVVTAPGCSPLDLFGPGSPSPQAIAYVTATSTSTVNYIQRDANANLSGEPFSTWAGPVSVAAGFEYRYETQNTFSDPYDQANDYEANNSEPLHGGFNVKEGFVETVVPLASKQPWARELDFNGAVREVDYSTSAGHQTPWKLGLTWNLPVSGLLLRMTRSTDIRAPNLYELDSEPSLTTVQISYGTATNPLAKQYTEGNPNLLPEVARTWTGGFAYQPTWAPGLQLSTDYYSIDLTNEITTLSGQQEATYCYDGVTLYCPLITFGPGNVPEQALIEYLNIASNDIAGVDSHVDYALPQIFSIPGNFQFSAAGNWLLHDLTTASTVATTLEGSGDASGGPHFRATGSLTWNYSGLSLTVQGRFLDHMKFSNELIAGVTVNRNEYPAIAYMDLFGSYQINKQVQFYATVYNLLNQYPPNDMPNQAVWYDDIGTTMQIGVRAHL